MESRELIVITINVVIILIAYLFVYPKYAGSDGNKLAVNDLYASCVVLLISGVMYWGSGYEFSLLITTSNWFWFTLVTYFLLDIPLMAWYFKKHKAWESFKINKRSKSERFKLVSLRCTN